MASEIKLVAASIVNFLKQQLEAGSMNEDGRESVEVSVQCIEAAFEITAEDTAHGVDLLQLLRQSGSLGASAASQTAAAPAAVPAHVRDEAEAHKNQGNELMKQDKPAEALAKYTRAIELDSTNPVYFCNRAAAQFKLGEHQAAVADCASALALDPHYGKAHGRLGLALTALDRHREARASFARASELDPTNESYRQNLQLADDRLSQRGERGPLDINNLLQSPALMNMATTMLTDPNMQHLLSGLISSPAAASAAAGGGGGMAALLEAGQALAQQMQAANPELVEQLRRQAGGTDPNPPPKQ